MLSVKLIAFIFAIVTFLSAVEASPTPVTATRRVRRSKKCQTQASSAVLTRSVASSATYQSSSTSPNTTTTYSHATTSYKASSSSSSYYPPQSSSPSSPVNNLAMIYPAGQTSKGYFWSTSPYSAKALPLADDTFYSTADIKSLKHPYLAAPDGRQSMQITYPEGTAALSGADAPAGGVSFYALGSIDLTYAKEVTLSYSVLFDTGFQFNMGGKLPGLYGGDTAQDSISCSGGRKDDVCFSTRFMWRTDGAAEGYFYLPPSAMSSNKKMCSVAPLSDCDDAWGTSVGRGAFYFKPGQRTFIGQRVRLNDAGKANGEIEVYHDGNTVFKLTGMVLRTSDAGRIRGIQMQSFFGGHTPEWASPQTQHSWLSDFTVAVTQML